MARRIKTEKTVAPYGSLESRNLKVGDRRTSMRLEPVMWESLEEISKREGLTISELVSRIKDQASLQQLPVENLTSAVRVFIAVYYRRATTPEGHARAGHGSGEPFRGTPFGEGLVETERKGPYAEEAGKHFF
jgi:predicted DNA-binding ribbon-helix-helix protein